MHAGVIVDLRNSDVEFALIACGGDRFWNDLIQRYHAVRPNYKILNGHDFNHSLPQHFLNFRFEPQGHGLLRAVGLATALLSR